jgi:RNA-binding protein YlmH
VPALAAVQLQLKQLADIQCVPWGGYPSAERCRLVFGREELLLEVKAFPEALAVVKAVQVCVDYPSHHAITKGGLSEQFE